MIGAGDARRGGEDGMTDPAVNGVLYPAPLVAAAKR
jgi:hypothetical protein